MGDVGSLESRRVGGASVRWLQERDFLVLTVPLCGSSAALPVLLSQTATPHISIEHEGGVVWWYLIQIIIQFTDDFVFATSNVSEVDDAIESY